jgi:hypothetical protein
MQDSLAELDQRMPKNQEVQILQKSDGWIRLSPFQASPEPINLDRLKTELSAAGLRQVCWTC